MPISRLLLSLLLAVALCDACLAATPAECEVLVYGGTPAGIGAALAAGRQGRKVILVEPYRWIGGLTTNGLSHPDFRTFEALTGVFHEHNRRVLAHYTKKYRADSQQVKDSLFGTHPEPHVARAVWEEMLRDVPTVQVFVATRLVGVDGTKTPDQEELTRIDAATFSSVGGPLRIAARVFIDATYEGDLMAAAGVPFRVGREGRSEHNESLAPEKGDDQLQGYNFRLTMTPDPENRTGPIAPPGYRRDDFLPVLPLLEGGKFKKVFDWPSGCIFKAQIPVLPNKKYDINDVSHGVIRLSLPGTNGAWPTADAATREQIQADHLRHNVGLLYFLQTDEAVPAVYQEEARRWGFCRDEFVENGHLPEQLYVREARRMVGRHIFTQHDVQHAKDDARGLFRADAVAMGDYGPNCHGTAHEGPRFGGRHTGEFYSPAPPYQISYGVLTPQRCENLLVPVACSSSHVGFCALRLEPIWGSLGEASGSAAHLSLVADEPVQKVDPAKVRELLHKHAAATIYVSDVRPEHPDFAAVQWWGSRGGLHGLNPAPQKPGERGAHRIGQYYAKFPGHDAALDRTLDDALRDRWSALARGAGNDIDELGVIKTRGDFIRRAHRLKFPK